MNRRIVTVLASIAAVAALAILAAPAKALPSPQTSNLSVTATVAKSCSIATAGNVAFGTYDALGASLTGNGSFTVNCSKGTTWDVKLDNGTNAVGAVRNMKDPVSLDKLAYELYKDAGHTIVWNATTFNSGTGPGPTTLTVFGTLANGQFVTPGSYSDTVVASILF
jgi:spore coat protein U-like protein